MNTEPTATGTLLSPPPCSRSFRAGDTVHHEPSGEEWTLANDPRYSFFRQREDNGLTDEEAHERLESLWDDAESKSKAVIALASESQREAAGTADEKPDGQAENAGGMARELAARDPENITRDNG